MKDLIKTKIQLHDFCHFSLCMSYGIYMANENNLFSCFWFFEMVTFLKAFKNNVVKTPFSSAYPKS